MSAIQAPKVPCGSCPYRKDVPSGVWTASEYEKLPDYDAETWAQPTQLFMCHQRDGCLCGGWLATHGPQNLLALRIHHRLVDPSVWDYAPDVEVFASGLEAAEHGCAQIDTPSEEAKRKIDGLIKLRDLD